MCCVQAGIYTQVNRWFQNHSYNEKQNEKKKGKTKATTSEEQTSDDEAAIEVHLAELKKELKRKSTNRDKVSRLLSQTFTSRRTQMMTHPANSRVSSSLQQYPCFKSSLYVSN